MNNINLENAKIGYLNEFDYIEFVRVLRNDTLLLIENILADVEEIDKLHYKDKTNYIRENTNFRTINIIEGITGEKYINAESDKGNDEIICNTKLIK